MKRQLPNENNDLFNKSLLLIIYTILGFSMVINGYVLLTASDQTVLKYLSVFSKGPLLDVTLFRDVFHLLGLIELAVPVALVFSLFKGELKQESPKNGLKWALVLSILACVIYGFLLRYNQNVGGAASQYFLTGMLFLLLWYIENSFRIEGQPPVAYESLKYFLICSMLFYTMGLPGFSKLFGGMEVHGKYIQMFSHSILAKFPGGISPFIYLLGFAELMVPLLLVVSIIRLEFKSGNSKIWLKSALILTAVTFTMLCFGLSLILQYEGAVNLVYYTGYTLVLYAYIRQSEIKNRI